MISRNVPLETARYFFQDGTTSSTFHIRAAESRRYRKVKKMVEKLVTTSMFTLMTVAALVAPLPEATAETRSGHARAVRLAMDNMGGGGSMMMDDNMGMQPQGQSSQPGRMGGTGSQPSPGQMGGAGNMQSGSSGQSGMMMDDKMRMQSGQPGQGGGMQSQSAMGQGNSMGQGCMGMMMDSMMRMRSAPGMTMNTGAVDLTDRIEGRLAFLRAEVRIADAQAQAWNSFADAIRSSRQHLLSARQMLTQSSGSSSDRLERHERHLAERLEALRSARVAYGRLYATLDDGQKRTADELVVPFMATF